MAEYQKGHNYIWNSHVLYAAPGMYAEFHEHYAASIAVALDKPIHIETRSTDEYYQAAIVAPNVYHQTISPDTPILLLLLDPESLAYQSLESKVLPGEVTSLESSLFDGLRPTFTRALQGELNCSQARQLFDSVIQCISGFTPTKRALDSRVEQILRELRLTTDIETDIESLTESLQVADLASKVNLSADRLMRLFKEEMGIPIRRFILWRRILKAVHLLSDGLNLTEAAHEAGFADSAHLSRTFKKNFGIQPSFFFGSNPLMKFHFCD
ncbi:MAG: helix-turn-helix transcriptional regulator [Leptospiraceae bacterium]|nr:helix-turn-helix transcriptional regulator [Leptospiraceae bacterium]